MYWYNIWYSILCKWPSGVQVEKELLNLEWISKYKKQRTVRQVDYLYKDCNKMDGQRNIKNKECL